MTQETNEQRMKRLADEESAIVAMEQAIRRFRTGEQSYRQTMADIDEATETRIVRVGPIYTPEVRT
jgi:exonuclease VII small subunit